MAPVSAAEWGKLKVVDLRAELKKRGLAVIGRKDDLVNRLVEAEGEEKEEKAKEMEMTTETEKTEPMTQTNPPNVPAADHPEPGASFASLSTQTADNADEVSAASPVTVLAREHEGKRKRSASPEEDCKRQRVERDERKVESGVERERVEPEKVEPKKEPEKVEPEKAESPVKEPDSPEKVEKANEAVEPVEPVESVNPASPQNSEPDSPDISIPPALHPATTALYITNLMRPLRLAALDEHLAYLATPPAARRAGSVDDSVLVQSYLDDIKTHAFVVFRTATAAARVRSALHGRVWPNDSNRRPLWVDFVPPEAVARWIEQEEAAGGRGRSTKKWEVVYGDREDDGTVATWLQVVGSGSGSRRFQPLQSVERPQPPTTDIDNAPKGPRLGSAGQQDMDRRQLTRTVPRLDYRTVHPDLAQWRLDSIRRLTSVQADAAIAEAAARSRDYSKNNHRYTFENGAQLVDRGPEMFDGIRPPHRERERHMVRSRWPRRRRW